MPVPHTRTIVVRHTLSVAPVWVWACVYGGAGVVGWSELWLTGFESWALGLMHRAGLTRGGPSWHWVDGGLFASSLPTAFYGSRAHPVLFVRWAVCTALPTARLAPACSLARLFFVYCRVSARPLPYLPRYSALLKKSNLEQKQPFCILFSCTHLSIDRLGDIQPRMLDASDFQPCGVWCARTPRPDKQTYHSALPFKLTSACKWS